MPASWTISPRTMSQVARVNSNVWKLFVQGSELFSVYLCSMRFFAADPAPKFGGGDPPKTCSVEGLNIRERRYSLNGCGSRFPDPEAMLRTYFKVRFLDYATYSDCR